MEMQLPSVNPGVSSGLRRQVTTWTNSIGQSGSYINNVVGASFKSGVKNPRAKWRPCSSYRAYYTQVIPNPFGFKDTWSGITWFGTTDHVNGVSGIPQGQDAYGTTGVDPRVPVVSSNLINEVKTHAMLDLGNASADLSADLVEVAQTIDLIADLLARSISAYNSLRSGRYADALKALTHTYEQYGKYIKRSLRGSPFGSTSYGFRLNRELFRQSRAGGYLHLNLDPKTWWDRVSRARSQGPEFDRLWLELQYGWLPLLGSVAGTIEWLGSSAPKRNMMVTGYASRSMSDPPTNYSYLKYSGTSFAQCECKVIGLVTNPELANAQAIGLTAFNLITAAWEGMPFSFIVDWVIPVSSWLQALSARQGLTYFDGYLGLKRVNDFVVTSQMAGRVAVTQHPSLQVKGVIYQRIPLGGFPIPGLYYKSPFSSTHVANALALVNSTRRWY